MAEEKVDPLLQVVEKQRKQLLKQVKAGMDAMREEYVHSTGARKDNAKAALDGMKEFRMELVRMHRKNVALTPEQARRLLSAVNQNRKLVDDLQSKNSHYGSKNAGDGKTITERLRERQKDLATRESIVDLLEHINDLRERANANTKRRNDNLTKTFRQGLSAFLGPAGPLVETFFQLKEEYGDDAKEITKKVKRWLGMEKDVLDEFEKETARADRRDRKLFDMMTNKFKKFGSMLGNLGRGMLDSIMDFMGWGGGKGGKGGGGAGKAGKAAKGGWWGKLGKWGGKLGKAIPFLGTALGLWGMYDDVDAGAKKEGVLDTGLSYAGGAMTGASIGTMLGGPIGALIGGVVGLLVTGVMRNWTSFKSSIVNGWNGVVDSATTAWGKLSDFGSDFVKFSGRAYDSTVEGFKKMLRWLKDNIPGFDKIMQFAQNAKTTAGNAWQATKEVATDTKIAVAGAVQSGAQRVAAAAPATSAMGRSAQSVADFAGAVGGKAILERQMTAAGITDPKERAMMMAQVDHESGFNAKSENLNYRSVSQMDSSFGKNAAYSKLSADQKAALVNNPEALANVVYGNRMGNKEAGDGYKYRGRGMIQITGKDNYERYGKMLGIDLVNNPELANDPQIAARIATAYWQDRGLGAAAQAGDVASVTRGINGGLNGLGDRAAKYNQYMSSATQVPDAARVASSVAPAAAEYERAMSVAPGANVSVAQAQAMAQNQAPSGSTDYKAVKAQDIPLVLGENHMVVLNAAMLGA